MGCGYISCGYKKQKNIKNGLNSIDIKDLGIIAQQSEKSLCKIECSTGGNGTGFLCLIHFQEKINLEKVLMTNNHVLEEKDIIKGKYIKFTMNNDKSSYSILIDNSRKVYTSKKYDITIIEIKEKDGLINKEFLEIHNQIYIEKPNE